MSEIAAWAIERGESSPAAPVYFAFGEVSPAKGKGGFCGPLWIDRWEAALRIETRDQAEMLAAIFVDGAPHRVAAHRSSLRFGRNTLGIPPSRALSAGRLPGLGAHVGSTTGCSPRRCAPLIVAFLSEYTRASSPGGGSSLTRLVSRAPPRPRRSRGFHHRLFTASLRAAHRCVSVGIHSGQFSRWGLLPHAPCQPGASPPPGELASLGAHPGSTTGC